MRLNFARPTYYANRLLSLSLFLLTYNLGIQAAYRKPNHTNTKVPRAVKHIMDGATSIFVQEHFPWEQERGWNLQQKEQTLNGMPGTDYGGGNFHHPRLQFQGGKPAHQNDQHQ